MMNKVTMKYEMVLNINYYPVDGQTLHTKVKGTIASSLSRECNLYYHSLIDVYEVSLHIEVS